MSANKNHLFGENSNSYVIICLVREIKRLGVVEVMLRLFSLKFFLTQSKIKMDGLGGIVYILTARVHIMDKIQRYN